MKNVFFFPRFQSNEAAAAASQRSKISNNSDDNAKAQLLGMEVIRVNSSMNEFQLSYVEIEV
jgi:hypothetical protein